MELGVHFDYQTAKKCQFVNPDYWSKIENELQSVKLNDICIFIRYLQVQDHRRERVTAPQ